MVTETSDAGIGAADPLLLEAAAWVEELRGNDEDILDLPVSHLQLRFGIGFARACALVEALALEKFWSIECSEDGRRFARLRPGALV